MKVKSTRCIRYYEYITWLLSKKVNSYPCLNKILKHSTILDRMRFWLMGFLLVQMSPLYHSFNIQRKAQTKKWKIKKKLELKRKNLTARRRKNGATMTKLEKKKLFPTFSVLQRIFSRQKFLRSLLTLIVTAAKRMLQKILNQLLRSVMNPCRSISSNLSSSFSLIFASFHEKLTIFESFFRVYFGPFSARGYEKSWRTTSEAFFLMRKVISCRKITPRIRKWEGKKDCQRRC